MKDLIFVTSFLYGDEIARISSRMRSLIDASGSTSEKIVAINNTFRACNDLQTSMKNCIGEVLAYPLSSSTTQAATITDQSSLPDLRIRNYIDTCILRLQHSMLQLLFYATSLPDLSVDYCEKLAHLRQVSVHQSQAIADRILMTLPRFLPEQGTRLPNWADALRLLWPARLIVYSPILCKANSAIAFCLS